jgi:hypothetical protein
MFVGSHLYRQLRPWHVHVIPVMGSIAQADHGLGWPGQNAEPYLQNNEEKWLESWLSQ